ncbi:MAG: hypothetical protein CMQ41_00740 [Gammaproteobacteria bacterium]|nr:hypothetical protein [Gammaproteobacteria bacterium]
MFPFLHLLILIYSLIFFTFELSAYEITGKKWIGSNADFYVDFPGTSQLGRSWNAAFINALNEWSAKTPFNFNVNSTYFDPCQDDGLNSVKFSENICGQEFAAGTLAVTILTYESQLLGPPAIVEADIYIDQVNDIEIYDGELKSFPDQILDFRRIVLHELGHVIGLEHETASPAIMMPSISNLDRLQEDDIKAVEILYGGKENCQIRTLKFGVTKNSLSPPDCTVNQFTVGSEDDSHLDVYSFSLNQLTKLEFSLKSDDLETVILVADEYLNYLAADTDIANDCHSSLNTELTSGNYFLIVNTWNVQMKPACGTTGSYELVAGYSATGATNLGNNISLEGGVSDAVFTGSITSTKGQNFGNIFKSSDSIDISATISIDPNHQGKPGFIIVAAVIGDQILLLNENGNFIDTRAQPGVLIPARRKELGSVELIEIFENLITADLGIYEISVDFVVGYGLSDMPSEVFYHEDPLNLTIQM